MQRFLAVSLVTLLVALGGCGPPLRATADFSFAEAWAGYERVEVRTSNGSVELRSADVDEIIVSGTKSVGVRLLSESAAALEQVTVYAGPHASRTDTFLVELRYPAALKPASPGAQIVIQVPEPCGAEIDTGNGSIIVARLKDDVVLRTSNGRIEAEDVAGTLRADTSNGRILVRRIDGPCTLDTSNGEVHVEDARGDVDVETSNGRIHAVVAPPADSSIVLRTSNGSIDIAVPPDLGANLRLKTSNGRVRTELGGAVLQDVDVGRSRFEAVMNGGGGRLVAETSNGSIVIRCP